MTMLLRHADPEHGDAHSRPPTRTDRLRFRAALSLADLVRSRPLLADRPGISERLRVALASTAARAGRTDLIRRDVLGVEVDLDPSEYMQGTALVRGAYERDELLALRRLVAPGDVVVDIGANVGMFTLVAASATGPTGAVHAFEPNDTVYRRLRANVVGSPLRGIVTTWNLGLGEEPTVVTLWGSSDCGPHRSRNDGLSSAYRDGLRSDPVGTMRIERWDDLVGGRVDVVKLDCEGSELPALNGMAASLREWRPRLLLEANPVTFRAAGYETADLLDLLTGLGYALYRVGRGGTFVPLTAADERRADGWTLVAVDGGDAGRP